MLGRALGELLSKADGLTAAYLPEPGDSQLAGEIVQAANEVRRLTPCYALLISSRKGSPGLVPGGAITAQEAIRFRQGDHLAVVLGLYEDLASFSSTFRTRLDGNYPYTAPAGLGMQDLALRSLRVITHRHGVGHLPLGAADIDRVAKALEAVAAVLHVRNEGARPWTAVWRLQVRNGLDSLSELVARKKASHPSMTLSDLLARYTYAAFGLPAPDKGESYRTEGDRLGRQFSQAIDDWWSDEATIRMTVEQLAVRNDHPIKRAVWDGLDNLVAGHDHHMLAFQRMSARRDDVMEALAELPEARFLNPRNSSNSAPALEVRLGSGESLAVDASAKTSRFVVPSDPDYETTSGHVWSHEIEVELPLLAPAVSNQEDLRVSGLLLQVSPKKFKWDGHLQFKNRKLVATGRIRLALGKPPVTAGGSSFKLSLKVESNHPLAKVVDHKATAACYFLPPSRSGIVLIPIKASGALASPQYVGPDRAGAPDELEGGGRWSTTLPDAVPSCHVLAPVSRTDLAPPLLDGVEMAPLGRAETLWRLQRRLVGGGFTVAAIDQLFEVSALEADAGEHSPILAAVRRQRVTSAAPSHGTQESLRWRVERYLGYNCDRREVATSLGHIALPQLHASGIDELVGHGPAQAFLVPVDRETAWQHALAFTVDERFCNGEEVQAFRSAFAALDLRRLLSRRSSDGGDSVEVLSRTSWRHLWEEPGRARLARYLNAYSEMVEAAERLTHSPATRFWATYPFSVSVWSENVSPSCKGIMLSPLHPLRLAWLAATESAVWEAAEEAPSSVAGLLGTVTGWNMPAVGPRETKAGRVVAVPISAGEGQIFLGWSMMAEAKTDEHAAVDPPTTASGFELPGSSISGLNAAAVDAAVRSFVSMNPQVSTLTIDLASTTDVVRLPEVDDAVLTAVDRWMRRRPTGEPGGVRVLDSLRRQGSPPRDAIADMMRKSTGLPLSWSRYDDQSAAFGGGGSRACNLRLLQDSGVLLAIEPGGVEARGVVGTTPLRRFESQHQTGASGKLSHSSPTIALNVGWNPFTQALRKAELAHERPELVSVLAGSKLIDDKADWTVSGEAHVSPTGMSELIQSSGDGTRMLWEWRPPFLEAARGEASLERRPFITIARVPGTFKARMVTLLDALTGMKASEQDVAKLLSTLGSRGVGLSSLLSMGGTHATGALGFFLALELMAAARPMGGCDLVVPIDACDAFLRALSASASTLNPTRRADLLGISLRSDGLHLVPIEIKMYDLHAEQPPALPSAGHIALKDPVAQACDTLSVLKGIEAAWESLQTSENNGFRALWGNALATFIEAATRLTPSSPDAQGDIRSRLAELVDGDLRVVAADPVVLYLRNTGMTAAGGSYAAFESVHGTQSASVLAADASAVFAELRSESGEGKGPIVTAFAEILSNSMRSRGSSQQFVTGAAGTEGRRTERGEADSQSETGNPGSPNGADAHTDTTTGSLIGGKGRVGQLDTEREGIGTPTPASAIGSGVSTEATEGQRPRLSGKHVVLRPGVQFPVGRMLDSLSEVDVNFWPSNTALTQMNVGVVGDLGTGKTQLLKALVTRLRRESRRTQSGPVSVLIFDYKHDFQDPAFLEAVGGEVLRPQGIPLNVFALSEPYTKAAAYQRARNFTDILTKIYPQIGPVQGLTVLKMVAQLFAERGGEPPTMAQVLERYEASEKPDSVVSALMPFVYGEVFSDEPAHLIPFSGLLGDKVLVVALDALGSDVQAKNALVALFLNFYYEHMLNSQKWPYTGTDPQLRRLNSFILVDEALNIMSYEFPVLMSLMLQGREYGFGTILASQYLSHFKQPHTNYGEPLLTWAIHRVPAVTAKQLNDLGLTGATEAQAQRVSALNVHEALFSTHGHERIFVRGTPFYELPSQNWGSGEADVVAGVDTANVSDDVIAAHPPSVGREVRQSDSTAADSALRSAPRDDANGRGHDPASAYDSARDPEASRLEVSYEQAVRDFAEMAERTPRPRQAPFSPAELVLCAAANQVVDRRKFGGSNAHLAPELIHQLAALFVRPPSSVIAKMHNLGGGLDNGGRWDRELGRLAEVDRRRFGSSYRAVLAAARDSEVDEQRLPDFWRFEP